MKTISILNRKGGVGKSVVSLNLAYELQRKDYSVLLIDLDPQADATKILNAHNPKKSKSSVDIYSVLTGSIKVGKSIREVTKNLYYIPGSKNLIYFDHKYSSKILADILSNKKILKRFDFVIIVHPPALSEAALTGIVASDNLIIVTDPEEFSIQNLKDQISEVNEIKEKFSLNTKITGIVINKVDKRRSLTKAQIKAINQEFNSMVFNDYISNDSAIPISIHKKLFLRELHWTSKTVKQIKNIKNELLERL